jgi:hypothetical protein
MPYLLYSNTSETKDFLHDDRSFIVLTVPLLVIVTIMFIHMYSMY